MSFPTPAPDRVALVTGASSGIGAAIAREWGRRGHRVVLVARRADRLAMVAAEVRDAGGAADVLVADLADRDERAELPGRLDALGVTVDILVNNAGASTFGTVADADPARELAMVELDVVAVVDLCSRFVGGMVDRGRGAVLNVASTGAFQPLPGQAGYGAAKAFVLSYTQSLAGELRGTGVSTTVLCPGPVDTGFGAAGGFDKDAADASLPGFLWQDVDTVARLAIEGLAAGRLQVIPGTANRIGAVVGRFAPRRLLIPLLARQHPAVGR